jgi:carbamoyltransferase
LKTIILGINAYHADSSAAIFVDGKMIAATEEERFRRIKHWAGFPSQAIEFCLREAGVTLDQVDYITIGRDPKAKFSRKVLFLLKDPFSGYSTVKNRLGNRKKIASLEQEFALNFKTDAATIKSKIRNIEHHRSHMASAFFPSPFENAAILSIDGAGDFSTTMIGVGKGNKIEVFDSIDFPVSCGTFYTAFTQFLGFPHYGDEYKVMGLAPYGNPKYVSEVRNVLKFEDNGLFSWDTRYFKSAREVVVEYGEDHIPHEAIYSRITS